MYFFSCQVMSLSTVASPGLTSWKWRGGAHAPVPHSWRRHCLSIQFMVNLNAWHLTWSHAFTVGHYSIRTFLQELALLIN